METLPLPATERRIRLLADYAKVMGEIDAVNSRKPFDDEGEQVWEERRAERTRAAGGTTWSA